MPYFFPTFIFDWGTSSQFSFLCTDWLLLQANFDPIKRRTVKQSNFSIPTEVNMSTSQVDVTSDSENSEVESIIKLAVDEKQPPKLQYVYEMDEDTEEDPLDEDDAFE